MTFIKKNISRRRGFASTALELSRIKYFYILIVPPPPPPTFSLQMTQMQVRLAIYYINY